MSMSSNYYHRHPAAQVLPATAPAVTTDGAISRDDAKFHSPHVHTQRSSLLDPVVLGLRQLRVTQVPAYILATCIILSFLAGSWIHTAEILPAPEGPQVTVRDSAAAAGRRTLTMDRKAVDASVSRPINLLQSPPKPEDFEKFALSGSGFQDVRPALTPAESGDAAMHVIPFQTISWYPRMTYYPGFVDKARCEHIIELTKKYLSPSSLAYKPGESIPETQNVRTSSGAFLMSMMDPDGVLPWLEDRIAAVTHLPVEHGEAFNALRYMPTQHYDSHYDSFAEKEYGKQYSQRIATFLLFLNDVEEGGETVFKREGRDNGNRTITDWRTCDDHIGVKVKPKQGDAVLFWSARPDLQLDDHALHGACPVVKGEKWSIAKWIREKPIGMPKH